MLSVIASAWAGVSRVSAGWGGAGVQASQVAAMIRMVPKRRIVSILKEVAEPDPSKLSGIRPALPMTDRDEIITG